MIWLVARAGARAALSAALASRPRSALSAVALLPRLELLHATPRRPGYADPDGIGSLVFGDLRALVGRFGVSSSEITTLYAGAVTPALALIGWRRGGRDGAPGACSSG